VQAASNEPAKRKADSGEANFRDATVARRLTLSDAELAQKVRGQRMPQNGETNRKLGFYKNLCCGKEIVVPTGNEFPACPNHPGLTTIWKPLVEDNIVQFRKPRAADRPSRFKVGDKVTFVGVGAQKGRQGDVVEVIEGHLDFVHRYNVRINDGTLIRCFGFELELFGNESKGA
jgi:hypothetical protein